MKLFFKVLLVLMYVASTHGFVLNPRVELHELYYDQDILFVSEKIMHKKTVDGKKKTFVYPFIKVYGDKKFTKEVGRFDESGVKVNKKQVCFTNYVNIYYSILLSNGADLGKKTNEYIGVLSSRFLVQNDDEFTMIRKLRSDNNFCKDIRVAAWVKDAKEQKVGLIFFLKDYNLEEGWIELYNKNDEAKLFLKVKDLGNVTTVFDTYDNPINKSAKVFQDIKVSFIIPPLYKVFDEKLKDKELFGKIKNLVQDYYSILEENCSGVKNLNVSRELNCLKCGKRKQLELVKEILTKKDVQAFSEMVASFNNMCRGLDFKRWSREKILVDYSEGAESSIIGMLKAIEKINTKKEDKISIKVLMPSHSSVFLVTNIRRDPRYEFNIVIEKVNEKSI
ncbi:hypothetical protein OAT67_02540 [Bacteriovoracaceae bacterium]|nr:hypothetical protein [Bacteriovoracaceae bacterium]